MIYKQISVPDQVATGSFYRQLRQKAGLSQRQLAAKFRRRQGFISDLECGRRNWQPWIEEAYRKHCRVGKV